MNIKIEVQANVRGPKDGLKCDFCGQNKKCCKSFVGNDHDICLGCARAAVMALTERPKKTQTK
jgi:hypothetical protein